MASDGNPVSLTVTSVVPTTQTGIVAKQPAGKSLPQRGNIAPSLTATVAVATTSLRSASASPSGAQAKAPTAATTSQTSNGTTPDVKTLVAQLNKFLNNSGRPDQYRVDPNSSTIIQEVNPANGAVIDQFSASEFPALARSVGASGLLFDSLA